MIALYTDSLETCLRFANLLSVSWPFETWQGGWEGTYSVTGALPVL